MKTMAKTIIALCLISTFMHCHLDAVAQAQITKPYEPISLFDRRIRITGQWDHITKVRLHTPREDRWARESALNTFRSNISLEAEYFMVKQPTWELNLIGHFYYSREFMDMIDDEYDKAMPTYTKHRFKHTRDEDVIRELFFQYLKGNWDLRIGKQQVVWGEQLGIRTLDVVCPLDIRTEVIGLTEWENVRIGVWMLRGIYDLSELLPGQLTLEGIFIPFDYQPAQMPREGSFFGPLFHPDGIPRNGYLDRLISYRYYKDAHSLHGLNNLEWGIRLRGYLSNYDLDWTIIFFHTIDDGGVWADGGRGGYRSAEFFTAYNIDRTTNEAPKERIFDFKPYNVFGFSLQRYFGGILESVIRLEAVYESHKRYNKYDDDHLNMDGDPILDVVKKNSISYGLQISRKIAFPKWIPYFYDWSRGKYIDFDIALNQLYWFDYDTDFGDGDSMTTGYRVNGQPHGRGDNVVTSLSYMIMMNFLDARIVTVIRGTNYINSPSSQYGISISYRPGEHWGYSIGMTITECKRRTDPYIGSETKDHVTFKIYYMF